MVFLERFGLSSFLKRRKGQVSFEFILVLALVLLLTSAILVDVFEESTDTFVLNSIKAVTLQKISNSILTEPTCVNAYLKSISVLEGTVTLDIEGCDLEVSIIADTVEGEFCGVTSNGDHVVKCGDKAYALVFT